MDTFISKHFQWNRTSTDVEFSCLSSTEHKFRSSTLNMVHIKRNKYRMQNQTGRITTLDQPKLQARAQSRDFCEKQMPKPKHKWICYARLPHDRLHMLINNPYQFRCQFNGSWTKTLGCTEQKKPELSGTNCM